MIFEPELSEKLGRTKFGEVVVNQHDVKRLLTDQSAAVVEIGRAGELGVGKGWTELMKQLFAVISEEEDPLPLSRT
jgi:hypothetical protein